MLRLEIFEHSTHDCTHAPRILDQLILFVDGDCREACGAGEWVTVVSQSAVKDIIPEVIGNLASHAHRAELHVSTRQTFGHRDQVGNDFPVIDREPLTSATKPRHHFISNQENAVLVAKISKTLNVTVWRNEYSVRADNGFDDQCGNRFWSFEFDHFLSARQHLFGCVPTLLNAVIIIRDTENSGNSRFSRPATRIARERKRTGGATVVAAIARSDFMTSTVESRETNRILVCLSPTISEEENVDVTRSYFGKFCTQTTTDFSRHERIGISKLVSLALDCVDDSFIAMTDVDAHQLAVEIDEAFPFGRPEIHALGVIDRNWIDSSLGGPFKECVPATEFDNLFAGQARGSCAHNAGDANGIGRD